MIPAASVAVTVCIGSEGTPRFSQGVSADTSLFGGFLLIGLITVTVYDYG